MADTLLKAISLSKAPTDISKLTGRYYISQYDIVFDKPVTVLTEYYTLLKNNSDKILMQERYEFRPDYVSYDYYGTTNLWIMVMYVNDVFSIDQFNKRNLEVIFVPKLEIVNQIISRIRPNRKVEDISTLLESIIRGDGYVKV